MEEQGVIIFVSLFIICHYGCILLECLECHKRQLYYYAMVQMDTRIIWKILIIYLDIIFRFRL